MKRSYRWGLMALFVGVVGALLLGMTNGLAHKRKVAAQTSQLGTFAGVAVDGTAVRLSAPAARATVLIYFEPDCDHCQREAEEFRGKADWQAKARVLWLSAAPPAQLRQFATAYGVAPAQIVPLDKEFAYQHFGFAAAPDIIVYRADGSQAHRFKGETPLADIEAQL